MSNILSKSAFAPINTSMRFSNYANQLQQIQVYLPVTSTFSFKKQNVRQTTNWNNLSNHWQTNPEHYPELNKKHFSLLQKQLGSCSTLIIVRFNPRCIRLKKKMVGKLYLNTCQNTHQTRFCTQESCTNIVAIHLRSLVMSQRKIVFWLVCAIWQ